MHAIVLVRFNDMKKRQYQRAQLVCPPPVHNSNLALYFGRIGKKRVITNYTSYYIRDVSRGDVVGAARGQRPWQPISLRTQGHPLPIFFWSWSDNHSCCLACYGWAWSHPQQSCQCPLLWALMLMCVYPKNDEGLCALLGGTGLKTVQNKIWDFIFTLHQLNYCVVSCCLLIWYSYLNTV